MRNLNLKINSVDLYRNLSWEEYFKDYKRDSDGRVQIATYSFNECALEIFKSLMPFSVFYISKKYSQAAANFVRRFPMHLVFEVDELHSKCVYFEKSRRLLVGSQNLFAAESKFEELSCEFSVPEKDIASVTAFCFEHKSQRQVRPIYDVDDLQFYDNPYQKCRIISGRPYLPTHLEVDYWGLFSNCDETDGGPDYSYVYVILDYCVEGTLYYLAFDRKYRFCGELTYGAVMKLMSKFQLNEGFVFLNNDTITKNDAPFKDKFAAFHPIASASNAVRARYVNY